MTTTESLLSAHPFLADFPAPWVRLLADQARRTVHHGGSVLFREGGQADRFWLIRDGRVALEFHVPGRGNIVIEQLGPGTVLGWSWMFPPHRWHFGAVAAEQTLAIELNAEGVRGLCGENSEFGFELTRRFAGVLVDRLQAARMRLVDLYGYPPS